MDQLSIVNAAIAYIESRLTQPVTTAEVAAAIGYSRAHFGRLFLAMTGERVAGYIRKRRLSEAAYKLVWTRWPILELALEYQFESQEAFTRSFKQYFRHSPGAYRRRGHFTGAFHRITLNRQQIHRVHERERSMAIQPFLLSDPSRQVILPVQLYSLVMKHPEPSLQAMPKNKILLWYR